MDTDFYRILSDFFDSIQDPVAIFDESGMVEYSNEAFSILTGISQIRYLNKKATIFSSFTSLDEKPLNIERIHELAAKGSTNILKFETKQVMRGLGQVSIRKLEALNFDTLYMINIKDLTVEEDLVQSFRFEIANRNKKLEEMNHLVEIFQKIRLLDDPFAIINEFTNYILASSKVYAAANKVGETVKLVFSSISDKDLIEKQFSTRAIPQPDDMNLVFAEVQNYLKNNVVNKYYTTKSIFKNRSDQNYYWCLVPFRLANTEIFAIFLFENVEQLNLFAHQSAIILAEQLNLILNNLTLKELSFTDGLTKLKNSLYFRQKLEETCLSHDQAQLILFDVDFFKKVNDTYGHPGGDAVLIFIGEKIPQIFQSFNHSAYAKSVIARVGGEEFAVLIPDKSIDFAEELAEKIRSEIEASVVNFNDIYIKFTISIGVSSWDSVISYSEQTVKEVYKRADDALYNSKRSGRNKVSSIKVKIKEAS